MFLKNSDSLWKNIFSNSVFMFLQVGYIRWEQNERGLGYI